MESFLENAIRPKHRLKQHLYSARPEFKVRQKRSAFNIFGSETWTYTHTHHLSIKRLFYVLYAKRA